MFGECGSEKKWEMSINNGVGLNSNHSCLILRICVGVYGVMDTIPPPFLISNISDLSIAWKYILNSAELLILPWVLEPLCSLISGPWLRKSMCLPSFSIFLQLLCSLFVLVFFLLSWDHSLPNLLSTLLSALTLYCCYLPLEYNDDRFVRKLCCTVYLDAYNRRSKKGTIWWNKIYPNFLALK